MLRGSAGARITARADGSPGIMVPGSSQYPFPLYNDLTGSPQQDAMRWGRKQNFYEPRFDVYYDPTATAGSGTGTYANPFYTLTQLNAWINATAVSSRLNKVIGMRRGTKTFMTSAFVLTVAGSTIGNGLHFAPYGDSLDLPVLTGAAPVTNWVKVQSSPDIYRSATNQWVGNLATAWAHETRVYQNGATTWQRNGTSTAIGNGDTTTDSNTRTYAQKLADLNAQGHGTVFWDNGLGTGSVAGSLVFYPFSGENPNLGQVEAAISDQIFKITAPDQAFAGNILVEGLHIRGCRDDPLFISAGASNAVTNIMIDRCAVGQAGVDAASQGKAIANALSNAAVSFNTQTVNGLILGGGFTNGFTYSSVNNAVEGQGCTGLLVEGNIATDICGNTGLEMFASMKNCIVRYNQGHASTRGLDEAAGAKHAMTWISSFALDGSGNLVTDQTANTGNQIYMNYARNTCQGMVVSGGGSGGINYCHHNTFHCDSLLGGRLSGGTTVTSALVYTSQYAGASIDFSNNLWVSQVNDGGSQVLPVTLATAAGGSAPTGDYNAYFAQAASFQERDSSTTSDVAAWQTYIGAGFDAHAITCSSFTNGGSAITSDGVLSTQGKPMSGRFSAVSAKPLGYPRDIAGAPVSRVAPTVGCWAMQGASLTGQLITSTVAAGSATSLTTATGKTITSISLPPGDWDVSGTVDYVLGAATTTLFQAGVSATTNTMPTQAGGSGIGTDPLVMIPLVTTTLSATYAQPIPPVRVSLTATTTIYLVGQATFSAGTVTAYGTIRARPAAV